MFKRAAIVWIIIFLLCFTVGVAQASVYDSWANRHTPDANEGGGEVVLSSPRSTCNNSDYIAYIKFDLDALPENPISVHLSVHHLPHTSYCYSNCSADFYFYRVTSDWDESTITHNNSPSIGEQVYGPVSISFPNDLERQEYDITQIYNQWQDGTYDNYGLAIYSPTVGCNNASVGFHFYSSNNVNESLRPTLKILEAVQAEVWVDDDFDSETQGWGTTHFSSLQDGVDAASEGGTVNVAAGTYLGAAVHKESLVIRGQEGAIIDGTGVQADAGFVVTEPGVTIEGFTIQNWNNAGILLTGLATAHNSIIQNNIITANENGISAFTNGNIISHNTISDNVNNGIYIQGTQNTITNNIVTGNTPTGSSWKAGILVEGNDNIISGNTASNNHKLGIYILGDENVVNSNNASGNGFSGGWRGIHLEGSNNQITDNIVDGNNSDGIEIDRESSSNLISENTVTNNRDNGIRARGTNHTISSNTCVNNGRSGIDVNITDANTSVVENTVEENSEYGIYSRGGNTITGNIITGNGSIETGRGGGILAGEGDIINANNIYENHNYGAFTYLGMVEVGSYNITDFQPIDATNNWWGHVSGAAHASNPCGQGDVVSDNINFMPWYIDEDRTALAAAETVEIDPGNEMLFPQSGAVLVVSTDSTSGTISVVRYSCDDKDAPEGTLPGGLYLCLKSSEGVVISSATITINYTSPDGVDEASLRLYRWTGTAWEPLMNQSVNETEKTITGTTSGFSFFGVFGEAKVEEPIGDEKEVDEEEELPATGGFGLWGLALISLAGGTYLLKKRIERIGVRP